MSVFRWLATGAAASSRIKSRRAATRRPLGFVAVVSISMRLGRRGGRRRLGVAAGGLLLSGRRRGLLGQIDRLVPLAVQGGDEGRAFLCARGAGGRHVWAGHHGPWV